MTEGEAKFRGAIWGALAGIVVAVIGLFGTGMAKLWPDAASVQENNLQFVNLAIKILRSDPKENTTALRAWAVAVVNEHSRIKISEDAKKVLLTTGWNTESDRLHPWKERSIAGIDDLISKAASETDPEKRKELYDKIMEIIRNN